MPRAAPDVYLGCHADVFGWGGALRFADGLAAEIRRRGRTTGVLGVARGANSAPRTELGEAQRVNLPLKTPPLLWRIVSWTTATRLAAQLAALPAPRTAFVAVSPFWALAARQAWPTARIVFLFPCLLSNCLPFTWRHRRFPGLWPRLDYAGIRRVERAALDAADVTLVPTVQAADELVEFHPAVRPRLQHCSFGCAPPTGDDDGGRCRAALGIKAGAFVVLAAGVCDRNKAFDLALRELPAVTGTPHLLIVGDGPERAALSALAQRLGVATRAHFVGGQQHMRPWYAAADCVLSTSRYDTYPNVIVEALHCARPVVVPKHHPPDVFAGIAELVQDTGAGLLYDRRAPGALATALNRLAADSSFTTALGRRAVRTAQGFSWSACADAILEAPPHGVVAPPRHPTANTSEVLIGGGS